MSLVLYLIVLLGFSPSPSFSVEKLQHIYSLYRCLKPHSVHCAPDAALLDFDRQVRNGTLIAPSAT